MLVASLPRGKPLLEQESAMSSYETDRENTTLPRCPECTTALVAYEGTVYCPNCTTYTLPDGVEARQ
jgi:hypothetical protein